MVVRKEARTFASSNIIFLALLNSRDIYFLEKGTFEQNLEMCIIYSVKEKLKEKG
jgi:hypothetical protein